PVGRRLGARVKAEDRHGHPEGRLRLGHHRKTSVVSGDDDTNLGLPEPLVAASLRGRPRPHRATTAPPLRRGEGGPPAKSAPSGGAGRTRSTAAEGERSEEPKAKSLRAEEPAVH